MRSIASCWHRHDRTSTTSFTETLLVLREQGSCHGVILVHSDAWASTVCTLQRLCLYPLTLRQLSGVCWGLLGVVGGCWGLFGGCWGLLGVVGGCWGLLEVVGGWLEGGWRGLGLRGGGWEVAGGCWIRITPALGTINAAAQCWGQGLSCRLAGRSRGVGIQNRCGEAIVVMWRGFVGRRCWRSVAWVAVGAVLITLGVVEFDGPPTVPEAVVFRIGGFTGSIPSGCTCKSAICNTSVSMAGGKELLTDKGRKGPAGQ